MKILNGFWERPHRRVRLVSLSVLAAGTFFLAAPANAQGINVTVNGDIVTFPGQVPVQRAGSVLVPLRGVFEKMGANVLFDNASKTIYAIKGATNISLQLGQSIATVNGVQRTLSVPATAVGGTTLVPLRFVSEALGADVRWQAASRTVIINTNAATNTGTQTAQTQTQTQTPARVEVTSFTQSGTRALRSGETITATLTGTPGAQGTFSIPGIEGAQNLPLRETSPGNYVGTYTIPAGINVRGVPVMAQLKLGQTASPVIQTGSPLTVDAVGPTLSNLSPEEGATVQPGRPLIYGTYSDAGTGIDPNATRLIVNGNDLTNQATITGAFFNFTPAGNLPAGRNTVVVIARDKAGNETRREWVFTITPAETLIRSLTFTPNNATLEAGEVLTVRMEAVPGGTARFAVGGAVTDRPMQEQAGGVYVGTYTVKRGDSLAKAPVAVTFTAPGGRTVTQTATQAVTIAAGTPNTPVIDTPQEGAKVGGTVTITGRAAPNATVRYALRYQGRLVILSTSGTVAEGEVKADAQGRWTVPDIRLSAPLGVSNLAYSLQAVTVDATGSESEPATVNFAR